MTAPSLSGTDDVHAVDESFGFVWSLQFQFVVAMLVLLASFVPTIYAHIVRAREQRADEATRQAVLQGRQNKKDERKKKGGGGGGGTSVPNPVGEASDTAKRLRSDAEKEAAATRQAAKRQAEEVLREAQEEAAAARLQVQTAAAVREEVKELKEQAAKEAASLRKATEDELALLRKQVADEAEGLQRQKRLEEEAEQERSKMATEIEALRREAQMARNEAEKMRVKAKEDAAKMRQDATAHQRQDKGKGKHAKSHPPKPPKLQTARQEAKQDNQPEATNAAITARGDKAVTPPASSPHASPNNSPASIGAEPPPLGQSNALFGGGSPSFNGFSKWAGWPPSNKQDSGGRKSSSAPTTRAASPQNSPHGTPYGTPKGPQVARAAGNVVKEAGLVELTFSALTAPAQPLASSSSNRNHPAPPASDNPEKLSQPSQPSQLSQHTVVPGWEPPSTQNDCTSGGSTSLSPTTSLGPSTSPSVSPDASRSPQGVPAPPGKPVPPDPTQLVPYKLKLCRRFMEVGHCKRGNQCTYAHGEHEIGMERPAELASVTLGDMNKRKRGKNMIVAPAPQESYKDNYSSYLGAGQYQQPAYPQQYSQLHQQYQPQYQQPHVQQAGGYMVDSRSVETRQWSNVAGMHPPPMPQAWGPGQYHPAAASLQQQQQDEGWVAEEASSTELGPTVVTQKGEEGESPGSEESSQLPTPSTDNSSPGRKTPKQLSVDVKELRERSDSVDADKSNTEAAVSTKGRKEPSPFLPLSPAMDELDSWADAPTPTPQSLKQESFSWAEEAATDRRAR